MAWNCPRCREVLDEDFDVCWSCGTEENGTLAPNFQHADAYEPAIPDQEIRFPLATLLKITTVLGVASALLSLNVPDKPSVVTTTLIVVMAGYVFFSCLSFLISIYSWLLASRLHRWQRQVLADRHSGSRPKPETSRLGS